MSDEWDFNQCDLLGKFEPGTIQFSLRKGICMALSFEWCRRLLRNGRVMTEQEVKQFFFLGVSQQRAYLDFMEAKKQEHDWFNMFLKRDKLRGFYIADDPWSNTILSSNVSSAGVYIVTVSNSKMGHAVGLTYSYPHESEGVFFDPNFCSYADKSGETLTVLEGHLAQKYNPARCSVYRIMPQ